MGCRFLRQIPTTMKVNNYYRYNSASHPESYLFGECINATMRSGLIANIFGNTCDNPEFNIVAKNRVRKLIYNPNSGILK